MKIPQYILKKINQRANCGERINQLDYEIHEWMIKNGIENNDSFLDWNDPYRYIIQNSIMLITEPYNLKTKTIEYIKQQIERENK